MWLLIATLCLEAAPGVVECRREARGPYVERKACQERVHITGEAVRLTSVDLGARVIYLAVACDAGQDG